MMIAFIRLFYYGYEYELLGSIFRINNNKFHTYIFDHHSIQKNFKTNQKLSRLTLFDPSMGPSALTKMVYTRFTLALFHSYNTIIILLRALLL